MLAELSSQAQWFFGLVLSGILALIGTTWRVGNKVGKIDQHLTANDSRLDRLEQHEDDHDQWHRQKGIV